MPTFGHGGTVAKCPIMKQPDGSDAQSSAASTTTSVEATPTALAGSSSAAETNHRISADDLPIFREFIVEARGHLSTAEAKVLTLEANPQDAEAIDCIFRCFHSSKGV